MNAELPPYNNTEEADGLKPGDKYYNPLDFESTTVYPGYIEPGALSDYFASEPKISEDPKN